MTAGGPGAADVRVHLNGVEPWEETLPGLGDDLRRAVRLTLEAAGEALSPAPVDAEAGGELSLTLLDEDRIAELNREWLDRNGPTDVLAFDLGSGERLLGDVYLCPAVARRAAEAEDVPFREELVRLAVHGTLHVLGHDHPEEGDRWASPMFRLQEELVARAREDG